MNFKDIKFKLLLILIILLPYHYMFISVLAKSIDFLKYWKELIIILLFIIDVIERKGKYKIRPVGICFYIFFIVLVIYTFFSDNLYSAFTIGRIYFVPILLIPVITNLDLDKEKIKIMINAVVINTIILCIWGIFQQLVLKDRFLIQIGYDSYYNKYISRQMLQPSFYLSGNISFQRLTSTFVAPNTCAMYLAVVFTILLYTNKTIQLNKKLYYTALFLISMAIILTFSRSAWIVVGLAIVIYIIKFNDHYKRSILSSILILSITAIGIMIVDFVFLNGIIIKTGKNMIEKTLNFEDSSMIGHMDSLEASAKIVADNIWGLGFGNNGPKAISKVGREEVNLTESSYFLMAYDIGIIGAIIYFTSYILIIFDNNKMFKKYEIKSLKVISILSIMYLIAYIFLPYVQEFELLVYFYIIIALQYNTKFLSANENNKIVEDAI